MIGKNKKLEINSVLKEFFGAINLNQVSTKKISEGICNETFKIKFKDNFFVLQKLNHLFDNMKMINDYAYITLSMKKNGWSVPILLKNKNKRVFFLDKDKNIWRMYSFIQGNSSNDLLDKINYFSVGLVMAKFHLDLSKMKYDLKFHIPNFHNFDYVIKKLGKIYKKIENQEIADIAINILGLYKKKKIFFNLEETNQLIHGDARIENFLFEDSGEAFCLIDFDTFMNGSRYLDISDLIRSANLSENQTKVNFSKNKTKLILKGYLSINKINKKIFLLNVQKGLRRITIELCARFIIDILEDSYFGWDKNRYKSRKDNNIARAIANWNLFKRICCINLDV